MLPQFTHSGIKLKCPLPLRTRALRVPKGVEVRSAMTSIDQNINLCVDSPVTTGIAGTGVYERRRTGFG